jgi:hypothetical protein
MKNIQYQDRHGNELKIGDKARAICQSEVRVIADFAIILTRRSYRVKEILAIFQDGYECPLIALTKVL